ncbi:MAG: PEP-CTERM sorting domain-containing protein [Betaproteobacteria bacterium]|nr:PEP-CTERM sorting domain-containing protein [Betaproteobacteria bacterium]
MNRLASIAAALSAFAIVPAAHATVTVYDVVATFAEPQTQPKNTVFTGSFSFDDVSKTVSGLSGTLTEAMTGAGTGTTPGYDMALLGLSHQLSAVYDPALGGLLVTTFLNTDTDTLSTMGGGDGWSPGTGFGLYHGFPGTNPGNAYARIFVNTSDPTAPLTQAQLDRLAYADCTPGGMMGGTCMTGTTVAGYGAIGTMDGYPVSQTITAAVPEPETYALLLSGLGLVGWVARRRTRS